MWQMDECGNGSWQFQYRVKLCMLSHIVLLCCNETTGMKDVNDNVVLCLILEVLSQ